MLLRVVMMNDSSCCRLLNDFLVMVHIIVIKFDSTPGASCAAYDHKNEEENKANDDRDSDASTAAVSIVRIWQHLSILIVVVIIICAIIDYDHSTE